MEVRFAGGTDLDGWMALVESVKDAFPGLQTPEALTDHRATVSEFIGRGEAICAVENEPCFLAASPEYRRRHIAERLCV